MLETMSSRRRPTIRILAVSVAAAAAITTAACSTDGSDPSAASSSPAGSATSAADLSAGLDTTSVASLSSEVAGKFTQSSYTDTTTGKTLPYNIFLPDGYDSSEKYPLVLYIADSSLVGKEVTAPLSQYGALIWASPQEQARHPSIVVVPEYPEVTIDDNNGSQTTSDWITTTTDLVSHIQQTSSVDSTRVYATGQSMGAMMSLYMAAQNPDLFAAEYIVSGQWDISEIQGLTRSRFFYATAAGDTKATTGQTEVKQMLTAANVPFAAATWDATWNSEQTATASRELFSQPATDYFVTFTTGTVLQANPGAGSMEHMASFEPAYRLTSARNWLFAQTGT
jgi:predicted peptidase